MARLDQLADIEARVWSELAAAPKDKSHPWRMAGLATTDGQRGDARTIVLREVDPHLRTLMFFTDSRSPKVQQFERHPEATLLMWAPAWSWQLRLRATLSIETAGLAVSSRWARLKMSPAALDYLSPLPPGSPLARPLPERGSREYFAVVTAQVTAVDWLELHEEGQRRACFDTAGARWLTP